jgi:hypothetical protein
MFVHCRYCDYDSGDIPRDITEGLKWLSDKVKADGGIYARGEKSRCPKCGKENCLVED